MPAVVYFMGMEHTGHHLWHLTILFHFPHSFNRLASEELNTAECNPPISQHKPKIVSALNARRNTSPQFLTSCSYPCYSSKVGLIYPNVSELAHMERSIALSPKFIVMTRPTVEILHQMTLERLKTMASACEAMQKDIAFLKPHEYMCSEYENTLQSVQTISQFIGLNVSGAIRKLFRPTDRQRHALERLRVSNLRMTDEWHTLSSCQKRIRKMCSQTVFTTFPF